MRAGIVLCFCISVMMQRCFAIAQWTKAIHRYAFVAPLPLQKQSRMHRFKSSCAVGTHYVPFRFHSSRPVMVASGNAANLLVGLNQAQTQAVTAPQGPTIVLAGPGSGIVILVFISVRWSPGAKPFPWFRKNPRFDTSDRILAWTRSSS